MNMKKTKILEQVKAEFEKLAEIRQGDYEEKRRPIGYILGHEDTIKALEKVIEDNK